MTSVSAQGWRIALLTVSTDVVRAFHQVLSERGHELVALVLPPGADGARPRHPSVWNLTMSALQAVPPGTDVLIASRRDRLAPLLAATKPDVLLSFFFPWRIPPEALAVAPLGAVNVHPSLLPRHRGPNPLGWTLRNREPELGMTLHRMDANFDTGPVLVQGSRPVRDEDSAEDVVRGALELAVELLPDALSRVQWGDVGETQPGPGASYAGMFEDAWREVEWNAPAREVHLRVRACAVAAWKGRPHVAFATLEGQRVRIQRTRLARESADVPAAPGTVLERQGDLRLVRCADAPLWVTILPLDED